MWQWSWRLLLMVLAGFLSWQIVIQGISGYYVERLKQGDLTAIDKVLAWNPNQPFALRKKAEQLLDTEPKTAKQLLQQAIATNPADPRSLILLAQIAKAQQQIDYADTLVKKATDLAPFNPFLHREIADYWLSRNQGEQVLYHWSRILEIDGSLRTTIFPLLLKLVEEPKTRLLLKPYTQNPPDWWDHFFSYVARRALDLETVRLLYTLRQESAQLYPITEKENQAYIGRLQKEGLAAEAYILWVNTLDQAQREQLGLLYNGGFELEPTGVGFDWRFHQPKGVHITTSETYGTTGEKALHLIFRKIDYRFSHLNQSLFIPPGNYRLNGRFRSDNLKSLSGLKWIVRCKTPENWQLLAESQRFLGTNQWSDFQIDFIMPNQCLQQEIRLISAAKRPIEFQITGSIWFDALSIRRLAFAETPITKE